MLRRARPVPGDLCCGLAGAGPHGARLKASLLQNSACVLRLMLATRDQEGKDSSLAQPQSVAGDSHQNAQCDCCREKVSGGPCSLRRLAADRVADQPAAPAVHQQRSSPIRGAPSPQPKGAGTGLGCRLGPGGAQHLPLSMCVQLVVSLLRHRPSVAHTEGMKGCAAKLCAAA